MTATTRRSRRPQQPNGEREKRILSRHCQSAPCDKSVCRAGQRDGVVCEAGQCDIDDGIRARDPQAPAPSLGGVPVTVWPFPCSAHAGDATTEAA